MKNNSPRGTKVIFIGASDEQVNYGSNDDPRKYLKIGEIYTVDHTEIYGWHTKVYLQEMPDLKFNTVHFKEDENFVIKVAEKAEGNVRKIGKLAGTYYNAIKEVLERN